MKAFAAAALIAGLVSLPAFADCNPPPPLTDVPDGATASREQMIAAMAALKAYDAAVGQFLECMKRLGTASGYRYDSARESVRNVADKFNGELRAFKSRSGA